MLRAVAAISGLYDIIVGALLLFASGWFARSFGVPPATPPIFSDLNALFLLSIGIGYPPDWGEHTISLRQGDMTILQAGNTLHAIMGMWMDGWGIEISETILVTEKGCETLAKLPRELHHKP